MIFGVRVGLKLPDIVTKCCQQNIRVTARDNTGQNRERGHAPNPRMEMKIPDPAVNLARATVLGSKAGTILTTPYRRTFKVTAELKTLQTQKFTQTQKWL